MTLSDSRQSRRLKATLRPLPPPKTGPPNSPNPPSDVPCPLPRRIERDARVDYFSRSRGLPKWPEGRHPHCHFRGLLRLHTRYCRIGQPPKLTFVTRLQPSGYPAKPLVSYRTNRQLSGWIPPPLMILAFGAHGHEQTPALQQKRWCGPFRLRVRRVRAGLALQLPFPKVSESMGNHDSKIVDAG